MTRPGGPEENTIRIDGKTYFLATERGRIAHEVESTGKDLREEWDFRTGSSGMGETTRKTPTGYYYTDNIDRTGRGIRLSPTVTSVTGITKNFPITINSGPVWFFEEIDANSVRYIYACRKTSATTSNVIKIKATTNAMVNERTFTFASSTNIDVGRPERYNGFWYLPHDASGGTYNNVLLKLTTVNTGASNDTWDTLDTTRAGLRMMFQIDQAVGSSSGNTSVLGRIDGNNNVQTITGATNPMVDANWATLGQVGDTTGFAHTASSHAGLTLIGKGDNLYAFDKDGNSYPVIPFWSRGNLQSYGFTLNYGAVTEYGHDSGLWRVRNITSAATISIDDIPGYQQTPNINAAPIGYYFREGVPWGKWIYWVYSPARFDSSSSYIAAHYFEQSPLGLEVVWNTILKKSAQISGVFVDSAQQLWWCELGSPAVIRWIQLAPDGSPRSTNRGNASSTYDDWEGEVDFGLPEITKQLRYAYVEQENGTANCSWQLRVYRDSGGVENVGAAITTASTTNLNWTVGTTDTCQRARFRLTATTGSGWSAGTDDARIVRLAVYARAADRVRVVLTNSNPRSQRNIFADAKILRKLKDAGPVTIREPKTNETFTAYIRSVSEISYGTISKHYDGLEVIYDRFAVNV